MRSEYDVVVAGGGFAGLRAAQTAAENGADTVVFEQNDEIGYPIHTSGGSFVPDLERLGIPDTLYHSVDVVEFLAPSEAASVHYETPKFCVIDVRGVRQYLAEQAIDAGATVVPDTRVADALLDDTERVTGVTVQHDGEERAIHGDVTVDATGFRSVVAQAADLHDGFERFGRGIEYDLYAPEYDADTASLLVGNTIVSSGYGWMFPYEEDRVRVGVGSLFPDSESDLRAGMDEMLAQYSEFGLDQSARIESHSGVIPSEGAPGDTVGDGLIVTGDAANFPFGTVGEGIRIALETGHVAGEVAAERPTDGPPRAEDLHEYEEFWKSKYETSLQMSYAINERLAELEDPQWDSATKVLQSLDADEFYRLLRGEFGLRQILGLGLSHPDLLRHLGTEFVRTKLLDRFTNSE